VKSHKPVEPRRIEPVRMAGFFSGYGGAMAESKNETTRN